MPDLWAPLLAGAATSVDMQRAKGPGRAVARAREKADEMRVRVSRKQWPNFAPGGILPCPRALPSPRHGRRRRGNQAAGPLQQRSHFHVS